MHSPHLSSGYNNLDVGNVTSYAVTGLTPNTPYYYRIRAVGPGGTSASSNIITVSTLPLTGSLTALAGSNISTTGFTAKLDVATGATSYKLDVAIDNAFSSLVSGYNDLDVNNVTSYAVAA